MSLVEHAKREFAVLGWPNDCEMQKMMCGNIIELLELFASQGHSGLSASYLIELFNDLARFNPISPLTGEVDEWNDVSGFGGEIKFQNRRCSEVFKDSQDGEAYWISGKVFRRKGGSAFTNGDSSVPIAFPWTRPDPEIVDVE